MSLYNPERDKYTRFDSPEGLLAYCEQLPRGNPYWRDGERSGGLDWEDALRTLNTGDVSYVPAAELLMSQMADQEVFTTGMRLVTPQVVGFMPLVPAVLAGLPECMLNRSEMEVEATNTPISIYVQATVSSSLSSSQIANRGIAILALTMAFANIRPVELYSVSISDFSGRGEAVGSVTKIETKPLDIARAAFMLCSPTMCRKLGHEISKAHSTLKTNNTGIPHAWGRSPMDNTVSIAMRDLLKCETQDIYIEGGYGLDTLMLDNPVQWVKNMIAKHNNQEAN